MKKHKFLSILTTIIMVISMLPLGMMTAYAGGESDASLISVLGKTISAGSETGTSTAEAITASISVESTVSEISEADIVGAMGATATLYSDSDFTTQVSGGNKISLTSGGDTTVYIKVVSQDAQNELYYAVTISRAENLYKIEVVASPNFTFTAATVGYGEQAPYGVTVQNKGTVDTGELTITLGGDNPSGFTLSKTSIANIAVGESSNFNVIPTTGLAVGDYNAKITVSGDNVEEQSFHVSFTVTEDTVYPLTIRTYTNGELADVTGDVTLQTGTSSFSVPKTTYSGIYETSIGNGNYFVYVNGINTGKTVAISNVGNNISLEYYTVNFSVQHDGDATDSGVHATAGGSVITSGMMLLKGTYVELTATGVGAGSYTYSWTGTKTGNTATLTISSLSSVVDVICTVTGEGTPPTDPDYKINDNGYSWTGTAETIVITGSDVTLDILKQPSSTIKIDIQSVDGSSVTIKGNEKACNNTSVVVANDITLNLDNVDFSAPDNYSGIMFNKNDTDDGKANVNVIGTCFLEGGKYLSGIRSVTDQDLTITGTGTLNLTGGDSPDTGGAGHGIAMEGYSTPTKVGAGAKLTITGGVTINATGGNAPNSSAGCGIHLGWGDVEINGSTVTAVSGTGGANNAGSAISVSISGHDKTQGGQLKITDSTVTATGGNNTTMPGGNGIYVDNSLTIRGGTVTANGGSSTGNTGGIAIFAYQKDIKISDCTVSAIGGEGNSNGGTAIYSGLGTITVNDTANLNAVGGNGTKGGVGVRAPNYYDSVIHGKTVTIANDAGNVYIRGGQGATAQRDSIMGKDIFIGTGNIGSVAMDGGGSRSIKNKDDGDNVYQVNVTTSPAEEVEIRCEVSGVTAENYTYRAVTASDGTASIWLPEGARVVSATGYSNSNTTVVNDDTKNSVTLSKAATVTAHNSAELETYLAAPHISGINLVAGETYTYNGGTISRDVTIDGKGAIVNVGTGIDGTVVKMTSGSVPNATGKVFLEVNGAGSSLTLKNMTIQNGANLILCGINVKTGGSLTLDGVSFKGFYANPVSGGIVNNFGVHAEPEAISTIIRNCSFDASNALRNAVAIRGGVASITNSNFTGTTNPERLNNSDGFEYGVYLYGGTATVTGNTMRGYDGKLIPGYLSSPISTAPYYDITATVKGNTLKNNTVGINFVGAWNTLSYPCVATINGVALNSTDNAFILGKTLTAENTISNNTDGDIQLNLDQNDFYTDSTSTTVPKEEFGTPVYFGGLISLSGKDSSSATLAFSNSATAKAAIANHKTFVIQVSEDNGATWKTATTSAALTSSTKNATVKLSGGKTYLLRVLLTIPSKTRPVGSTDDVIADLVCYSNMVSVEIKSSGSGSSGGSSAVKPLPSGNTAGANVIVNGEEKSAGTAQTTKVGEEKTMTTVTVDSKKLQSVLETKEQGAVVVVPITGGANIATGALTGEMVKDMEKKEATLVIKTDASTYTLPASQINIDSVSKQIGEYVSLKDIKVTVSIEEPTNKMAEVVESTAKDGGFTVMVPAVDYTVKCEYEGKTVAITDFNAYIERTIAIPEGVDPTKITTGVVVEPDGTVHHVPTRVTFIDGKYVAVINSLTNSTYSVIYNPIEFADVENHWAKTSINNMGSRMVVSGIGKGQYEPNRNMTRAEFAAVMVRALGLEPSNKESDFSDVSSSQWYCGYIATATAYGVIKGYEDGTFRPNDTITREQAMSIIARAMSTTGLEANLSNSEKNNLIGVFNDSKAISGYAVESIATCLKTGVVSGIGNKTLAPKANISRGEVAAIVERLLQKSNLI